MENCDYYRESQRFKNSWLQNYIEDYGYCIGTKERDQCSCGGDPTKCTFYPNIRKQALLEKAKSTLQWKVWRYNVNARKIEEYNIFQHSSFLNDLIKLFQEQYSKEVFAEELKQKLRYYFWARCEFEVTVVGYPPSHKNVERKIDIYEQVMLNWDVFLDYVWKCKE